jgi:hypothetical protein
MSRDDRGALRFEICFDYMQVGSANAARVNRNTNLVFRGNRRFDVAKTKGVGLDRRGCVQKKRAHGVTIPRLRSEEQHDELTARGQSGPHGSWKTGRKPQNARVDP